MDTIVELSSLLLQSYRGDYNSERDTTDSVNSQMARIVPSYAIVRNPALTVDLTTKIDPLAPMADALSPLKMTDRVIRAYEGLD